MKIMGTRDNGKANKRTEEEVDNIKKSIGVRDQRWLRKWSNMQRMTLILNQRLSTT